MQITTTFFLFCLSYTFDTFEKRENFYLSDRNGEERNRGGGKVSIVSNEVRAEVLLYIKLSKKDIAEQKSND